jgi:ABC-type bacteriocin/lantibiotic exporter with double-glycine peptidase domain
MKIKLKPIKQSYGFCGPASFKMVMDFFGENHSQQYWAQLTALKIIRGKINIEYGCDDEKFVKVVEEIGYKGFCKDHSSIAEVKKFVKKQIPVIVNWFSPEEGGHFSVVVGFEKDKILLADPHFGKIKKHNIEWFEDRWFDHMPYPIKSLNQLIWVRRICVVYK